MKSVKRIGMISSRRGISLVEVIVALAVITIISAAAFSLMIYSSRAEADAVRTTSISAAADDVLECFRYAENDAEFFEAIAKLDEYDRVEEGRYVLNKPTYTLYLNIDNDKLSFSAHKAENGEIGDLIYSYEYTKG